MLLISFLVMAAGTLGILLLPTNSGSIMAFTVLFIVIYIFYNVNYAMTWAMMDEGAIPAKYSGYSGRCHLYGRISAGNLLLAFGRRAD